MASAVKELFPEVKLGIGPAISDGFYYDFEKEEPFTPGDLKRIEKKMREIVNKDFPFEKKMLSKNEAQKLLKKDKERFKLELLKDLKDKSAQLTQALAAATKQGDKLSSALKGFTTEAGAAQAGLAGIIGTQQKLRSVTDVIIKQVAKLEIAFGFLNRNYGLNRKAAGQVAQGFLEIAKATDTDIGKIAKYAQTLKGFAPLMVK